MPPPPFRPALPRAQRVGRSGEAAAVSCLEEAGYRILERNYRSPFGEVDVVAEEGSVLVFVEVKCRSSLTYGLPRDAVTAAKRRKLARTASHYLMDRVALDRAFRADVVEVAEVRGRLAGVRLIRGAFSIEAELERMNG
jgi:putative endonuclease